MDGADGTPPLTRAQRVQRLVVPVVVLGVVLAAVIRSFDFSPAARELPLTVGVVLLVLCVASIVLEIRHLRRPRELANAVERAERPIAGEQPAGDDPAETGFGEFVVFGVFALFATSWLLLGFPWGAALFLALFLKVITWRGWLVTAAVVIGTVVPLQYVFVELSNVPSYTGLLLR